MREGASRWGRPFPPCPALLHAKTSQQPLQTWLIVPDRPDRTRPGGLHASAAEGGECRAPRVPAWESERVRARRFPPKRVGPDSSSACLPPRPYRPRGGWDAQVAANLRDPATVWTAAGARRVRWQRLCGERVWPKRAPWSGACRVPPLKDHEGLGEGPPPAAGKTRTPPLSPSSPRAPAIRSARLPRSVSMSRAGLPGCRCARLCRPAGSGAAEPGGGAWSCRAGWSVLSGARQDLDRVADGAFAGGVGRGVDEAAVDGHGGGSAAVQVERLYRAE